MKSCEITKFSSQEFYSKPDIIATESLLSIEIIWGNYYNRTRTHLADLLRTPGHDFELALGLLFSLGIINLREDIISYSFCTRALLDLEKPGRIILELAPHKLLQTQNFSSGHTRHAGCGLCTAPQKIPEAPALFLDHRALINSHLLLSCGQKLKPAQALFIKTGGTHAAALFDQEGRLLALFEDVGRHNALDKLVGSRLKLHDSNLKNKILVMSSRASFELVQKAHMAQIPVVAAVGAVSTQAREYAQRFNITLVGFLRESSFNIYTCPKRIELSNKESQA